VAGQHVHHQDGPADGDGQAHDDGDDHPDHGTSPSGWISLERNSSRVKG
jgi:hypothetical protein